MTDHKTHIGYVLLSYGAKYTSRPLAERRGAGPQIAAIQHVISEAGLHDPIWRHDHIRNPKGPGSFPTLFAVLGHLKEHAPTALVFVDDTARLFRKLTPTTREAMLNALEPYHVNIFDVRRGKKLSRLKNPEWVAMLLSATSNARSNKSTAPKEGRTGTRPTKAARRVSQLSRAQSANRLAHQIAGLREELSRSGLAPNNVELARLANERGLQTSRGNPWSDVTVARAIKRITKPD